MSKKIGRNDPCPCGSGLKYKKCCIDKTDGMEFSNPMNFLQSYKEARKAAKIKQCLHPNHSECSPKIIGAHSIQNNRILKKIADNGHVYMPCPKTDNPFAIQTQYGRKEASVFSGFCKYHDKILFQPIEDRDFEETDEQIFLFIYRCLALEYHRKQESIEMEKFLLSKRPSLSRNSKFESPFKGMHLAINDLEPVKRKLDAALINKQYDTLTSIVWEFDGFSKFAASGFEAPTTDLEGTPIQNLLDFSIPACHIFYSVFPQNDSTYVIIAWLRENDELFSGIKQQLSGLSTEERKNYINNTLPICTENIAINPSSWDKLTQNEKDAFGILFWGFTILAEHEGHHFNRLEKPTFDLFSF